MSRHGMSLRIVGDLLLLLLLLLPAAWLLGAEGRLPRGIAALLALAWLFPISQLAYAEFSAIAFERFASRWLRNPPHPDKALYTTEMIEASAARFSKRVLGVFRVPCETGRDDCLISASVLNQFPLQVGARTNQPKVFPAGTRRIGTAETPFLGPLSFIHLFALEFHRRLDPTLNWSTLSGDSLLPLIEEDEGECPTPADLPELRELDAGLRRVGEWFRNRLDDDPGRARDDVHARSLFYLAHQAERLRHLLAKGQRGKGPSVTEQERFWAVMEAIGVPRPMAVDGHGGRTDDDEPRPDTEAFYTRQIDRFAERFQISSVHPVWIDLASFAPRLILVGMLVAFLHASKALSPGNLLQAHVQGNGIASAIGLALLAVGVIGAFWSYRATRRSGSCGQCQGH